MYVGTFQIYIYIYLFVREYITIVHMYIYSVHKECNITSSWCGENKVIECDSISRIILASSVGWYNTKRCLNLHTGILYISILDIFERQETKDIVFEMDDRLPWSANLLHILLKWLSLLSLVRIPQLPVGAGIWPSICPGET